MRIYLNQVPETGLSAAAEFQAASFDLDTEGVRVVSPVAIQYTVFLEREELSAHLTLHCARELVCARCLVSFKDDFTKETDLVYPTAGIKFVDLTDDIRQEIVMEYPMKPLCQETCKGVCPECGQNLNETTCDCNSEVNNQ